MWSKKARRTMFHECRPAERRAARAAQVAGAPDARGEGAPARRDVVEEGAPDHVPRVPLRRARELVVGADGVQPATAPLRVDQADDGAPHEARAGALRGA